MFQRIPNIFEEHLEFINLDPRSRRSRQTVTAESLYKRTAAIVPPDMVDSCHVLDLGCALGAMGHFALSAGCRSYTGVEVSEYYTNTSKQILSKYWQKEQFNIVHQDIEEFLDIAIAEGKRWDYVIAAGILPGFIDCASLLKKISKVTKNHVVIDTNNWPIVHDTYGLIAVSPIEPMNNPIDATASDSIISIGSKITIKAMDMIFETCSFLNTGTFKPEKILHSDDVYNTIDTMIDGKGPRRIIVRYSRVNFHKETIQSKLLSINDLQKNTNQWQFNEEVANRFEQEALTNIPSYKTVISKCVELAKVYVPKDAPIIDVGSAIGYTMQQFNEAGFTNVLGVESSQPMINKSYMPDRVVFGNTLPTGHYRMVMANWTLHFIEDKISYIKDIYNSLDFGGFFVLTEKTLQSVTVKDQYRAFKLNNGLSASYVDQKEEQLKTVMHIKPVDWYLRNLRLTNFSTVDIIHADLGFVTFLCVK